MPAPRTCDRRLDQQMNVIPHETEGEAAPSKSLCHVPKQCEIRDAVRIAQEDVLTVVSAGVRVVHCALGLLTRPACHALKRQLDTRFRPLRGTVPLTCGGVRGLSPLRSSSLDRAHAAPRGPPQRRDHRPCRPWQDHAGRRDAVAVRCLPGQRGRGRPRDGLDGPRAREGHHDPRQEHRGPVRRRQAQHRRHARPRGLRRRGRARPDDGRRRAAARRRLRGPAAADALRAAQGAREPAARDPGGQQGRPARRPHRRGRRRGLRAVHRPRRARGPDRVPDRLHERQGRLGEPDRGRASAPTSSR